MNFWNKLKVLKSIFIMFYKKVVFLFGFEGKSFKNKKKSIVLIRVISYIYSKNFLKIFLKLILTIRWDILIKKIIGLHWESSLPVQSAAYLRGRNDDKTSTSTLFAFTYDCTCKVRVRYRILKKSILCFMHFPFTSKNNLLKF